MRRWLWWSLLGGPLAFALDRLAAVVLVSGECHGATGGSGAIGLTFPQLTLLAITIVTALIAIAAGLVSWRILRGIGEREELASAESAREMPFWALGGLFMNAVFLIAILVTGASALAVNTSCP